MVLARMRTLWEIEQAKSVAVCLAVAGEYWGSIFITVFSALVNGKLLERGVILPVSGIPPVDAFVYGTLITWAKSQRLSIN